MIMPVSVEEWNKMTRAEKVAAMSKVYSPAAAEYVVAVMLGERQPAAPLE